MITYRRVGLNSSGAMSSPPNKLPIESLPPGAVLTRLDKRRSSQSACTRWKETHREGLTVEVKGIPNSSSTVSAGTVGVASGVGTCCGKGLEYVESEYQIDYRFFLGRCRGKSVIFVLKVFTEDVSVGTTGYSPYATGRFERVGSWHVGY